MNTPTPTQAAMKSDLNELLNALPASQGRAVRAAIIREVFALFDSATAQPEPRKEAPAYVPTPLPLPDSDVNGAEPDAVERAIEQTFREPAQAELVTMRATSEPNGFDPEGR